MRRKSVVTLRTSVALILLVLGGGGGAERIEPKPGPWPEGTTLKGIDGSVIRADSNDLWLFEVGRDVNEITPQIPMGTRFALLSSATLEHLVADVNDRHLPQYRLTAQVTQYRGANFLWTSYFLPLSKLKDANEPAQVEGLERAVDANAVAVDRMDSDEMAIPEEVAARLRTRRAARGPQRTISGEARTGSAAPKASTRVLVDAVGFIELQHGASVFVPDALGWNVARIRYGLLPCRVLEQAEQQLAAWPEPIRLKVAGVVTEYQGKKHLLLQRVIRVYNYGNFGG